MVMTCDVMERLGGFDEALDTGEDMNLLLRAHGLGIVLWACPRMRVTHHGEPVTLHDFARQQFWHASSERVSGRLSSQGEYAREVMRSYSPSCIWVAC